MNLDINHPNMYEFIKQIPKTDLHVHLDGSIRIPTIIDIARKEKIELPSYTPEGLNEVLFKERYRDLEEYLTTFAYSCQVMRRPEYLERIAYEFAVDNQEEGVCYVEVRFAPHLHINDTMDMKQVLIAVNKGLERAKKEYNNQDKIKNGLEPPFNYGIIVCALRSFDRFSDYYNKFIDAHPFSQPKTIFALCSFELAQGVVKIRDEQGVPIVGFDLAGAENGFPAADHWEAYQYVHENFMHKTVHAGEAYGPESIFQAITELHADRIGHGYFLFDTEKIEHKSIHTKKAKEKYVEQLANYIGDRRITIEICLTSNLQTNPSVVDLTNHSFKRMLENKISTTFCTDNRTVSKTNVSKEILLAIRSFPIDLKTFKNTIMYGFKRSFYPGSYLNKRNYIRQVEDSFSRVEQALSPLEEVKVKV